MKKLILLILFININFLIAQVTTTIPQYPTQNDSIVIILDATKPGAEELLNYTGTVYAHTGVTTNLGQWQHVIGQWGVNSSQPALTRLGPNLYKLTVGYPRQFYSVTNPSEQISQISVVFRSADASKQTRPDIFIDIYQPGLNLIVQDPDVSVKFGDPLRSPAFVKEGDTVTVNVSAIEIGTAVSSLVLSVDNVQVAQSDSNSISYKFAYNNYSAGAHNIKITGVDSSGHIDTTSFVMFVNPQMVNEPLPAGKDYGINYNGVTSATLAIFGPDIDFIYLIGDFNDWKVSTNYFLKREYINPDSVIWWTDVTLSPGTEYGFQYLVNGKIRTADPFTEKILDPWNDQYIPSTTYPGLKPYPTGKTESLVGVLQSGQSQYQWQVQNFQKPQKENLVIYELLVRDFSSQKTFQFLIDTLSYLKSLGVNAIELMPIMEFSGNLSWGYNPVYHLAVDKFYGTANKLKEFIDECHLNGIAVILDMVLNHTENLSPMAMMWWDDVNNRPAVNSPYLNPVATHPFSVFNDFNHESTATKYFVDRVNSYWLEEFKFDGFRFDLSKGFTQTNSGGNVNLWGQYDQSRVNILKRMANKIWEVDSTAYVILEHFADNSEEIVLSNYGMMLWGNHNCNYNQATMAYQSGPCGTWDFSGISYKNRGWTNPNLVGYMESHDEERLMYKNLQFGNSNGSYDIKFINVALNRIKQAAAFFFTIPGPKLLWQFGELGYDVSIDFNGRTGEKPILWNYLNDDRRTNLYKVFQAVINLKKNYEAFSSNSFTVNAASQIKYINISHPTMDVYIVGNFGVTSFSPAANFSRTGMWYDYFGNDSLNVSDVHQIITLAPGDFYIYTTTKLPAPPEGILNSIETIETGKVESYSLEQNYPNPFNPSTIIRYSIVDPGNVSLKVYDVLGREVKILVNEIQSNGSYEVNWKGDDNFGNKVSTGIYFYRIESDNFFETKKMILLK